MVTDAKDLFDFYHRESLVPNVTDRRSSLEIKVVKEQILRRTTLGFFRPAAGRWFE